VTVETIKKLKFELLPHPAYSPDLIPSDYHIFELLKDALCGHQFANDE
jgi:histone-lysine N-methyltransferase SETMAR